jgi:hypothetical protein
MVRLPAGPLIVALLGCLGAVALGLTTYTLPIQGAASDPDLARLLHTVLHDSTPTMTSATAVLPVRAAPIEAEQPAPGTTAWSGSAHDEPTTDAAWLAAAVAADSAAVRDWLGRWVWATAVTQGDTLRLSLHRVSLRPGCPWMSRLDAITTRSAAAGTRLVRVTGTCPRLVTATPTPTP